MDKKFNDNIYWAIYSALAFIAGYFIGRIM